MTVNHVSFINLFFDFNNWTTKQVDESAVSIHAVVVYIYIYKQRVSVSL